MSALTPHPLVALGDAKVERVLLHAIAVAVDEYLASHPDTEAPGLAATLTAWHAWDRSRRAAATTHEPTR